MVNAVLANILTSGVVTDKLGNIYTLHSSISHDEGEFIWRLIRDNAIDRSIEVGCAFGVSSLYICDALSQ